MAVFPWIIQHWLDLLQSIGIVGGLALTAISLRSDTKVQRVSNLLNITKQHREIWTRLYEHPELKRVISPAADLAEKPLTDEERLFIEFVVLHLNAAQEAIKQGMFVAPENLRKDVRRFFSLPLPKAVWELTKDFQDRDLVRFVEQCLAGPNTPAGTK
jgi:hypothetical protein